MFSFLLLLPFPPSRARFFLVTFVLTSPLVGVSDLRFGPYQDCIGHCEYKLCFFSDKNWIWTCFGLLGLQNASGASSRLWCGEFIEILSLISRNISIHTTTSRTATYGGSTRIDCRPSCQKCYDTGKTRDASYAPIVFYSCILRYPDTNSFSFFWPTQFRNTLRIPNSYK